MNQNPYARFIKALDKEKEDLSSIATVVSTNPLKIKIGDLEIDKDNILINPSLLDREVFISTDITVKGPTGSGGDPSHRHKFNTKVSLKKHRVSIETTLKIDDEVLIVRNGQIFIIVCKVVNI